MLRIVPEGWPSREFTVFDGEQPIGRINFSKLSKGGEMTIGGRAYRVYSEGGKWWGRRTYVLANGGVLAQAELYRAWSLEYGEKRFRLEASSGFFSRRFALREEDGRTVGSGSSEGFFSRNIRADLPEELPLAVRAFIVFLGFILWRQDSMGSAGDIGGST